mmetsp:Transcript_77717/g.161496  ORF Transcript_77717/g.161496 Transcript_77717/m.161496 type:complete len:355 (+) Transcript_77717:53-1117(+)
MLEAVPQQTLHIRSLGCKVDQGLNGIWGTTLHGRVNGFLSDRLALHPGGLGRTLSTRLQLRAGFRLAILVLVVLLLFLLVLLLLLLPVRLLLLRLLLLLLLLLCQGRQVDLLFQALEARTSHCPNMLMNLLCWREIGNRMETGVVTELQWLELGLRGERKGVLDGLEGGRTVRSCGGSGEDRRWLVKHRWTSPLQRVAVESSSTGAPDGLLGHEGRGGVVHGVEVVGAAAATSCSRPPPGGGPVAGTLRSLGGHAAAGLTHGDVVAISVEGRCAGRPHHLPSVWLVGDVPLADGVTLDCFCRRCFRLERCNQLAMAQDRYATPHNTGPAFRPTCRSLMVSCNHSEESVHDSKRS